MTDDLDELIKRTEAQISSQKLPQEKKVRSIARRAGLPRVSSAFAIWLVAILIAAFEFDNVISIVFDPADVKIEQDLTDILNSAAQSLRQYEQQNGTLPPILPNPSIRGLVKYERRSDFNFILRATVADVSLVLESDKAHPYREEAK
jgi:hypothetical protein